MDVKAKDQRGCFYQLEIQLLNYPSLTARMLYAWCDLYSQQLHSGQDYHLLQPTYAIWLVNTPVFTQDDHYRRYFAMRDERQQLLLAYGGILVVELKKFQAAVIATQQQRWLQFFNQAETFTDPRQLPDWMQDTAMEQAMNILKRFSEKDRDYHQYQARQNYLREQSSIQKDIAELRQTAEAAQIAVKTEQAARQQAQQVAEAERSARQQAQQAAEAALTAQQQAQQAAEAERMAKEAERAEKEAERMAKQAALTENAVLLAQLAELKAQVAGKA